MTWDTHTRAKEETVTVDVRLEVREVRPDELGQVAELTARGMRDNPMHVAVFGEDVTRRERRLEALTGVGLPMVAAKGVILGAYRDGELVGVAGMMEPGRCQTSASESLRLLPRIFGRVGPAALMRIGKWLSRWGKRDLAEPHWHLGPVVVDRELQRRGIGSALMEEVCARMDRQGALMYLETDKPGNVAFYERYGFETIGEELVLGTPNWFMKREARREPASRAIPGRGAE